MHEHFFDHVNIPAENIHIPDGLVTPDRDRRLLPRIRGQAFKRPAASISACWASAATATSASTSRSACATAARGCVRSIRSPVARPPAISSAKQTCRRRPSPWAWARFWRARKILLMALGEHKANMIRECCEGTITPRVPASFLLEHDDATVLVDAAAGKRAHLPRPRPGFRQRGMDRRPDQAGRALALRADEQSPAQAR